MNPTTDFKSREHCTALINQIRRESKTPAVIMEVCGGHTMALYRNGITALLPENLRMVSGPGCPVCVGKQFDFLSGDRYSETFALCGRNAVQISLAQGRRIPVENLKSRLKALGEVTDNGYFLSFKVDAYELIIFPEGRTMIKGTTDESIARTLFAKYVGA